MLRMMRELTGVHLTPTHVRFVHIRAQAEPLSQFFGCEIEFGAAADELIFPGSAASLPIVMADPYLNRLLLAYCDEALAQSLALPESFRCRVENAVVPLLPHGMASAAHIADRLGVSQRTLARGLASEGLTFTGVIRELRRALALRYLEEKNLTIAHIAWLLGYKRARAFSKAFEGWTGDTPEVANPRLA
jgi:AraC-like DNA-binding protein